MALEKLFNVLHGSAEYERLRTSLIKGEGALSVFGLGEAHRLHTVGALYNDLGGTLLFVAPSAASANRVHEELSRYHENALLFPPCELPIAVQQYTESPALSAQRLACILKLLQGESVLIVTCIEALMQRMAPPELIINATHTIRPGMVIKPEALLKKFIDAGYVREEICEGPGQVTLRGARLTRLSPI